MGAWGAAHRRWSGLDALRRPPVGALAGCFAIGALGAAAVGLTVGFQGTHDPAAGPVRFGGALLTGVMAGLVGRGIWGWVAASAGAALAVLPFALTIFPGLPPAVGLAIFSCLVLAPGYAIGYVLTTGQRRKGADEEGLPGNAPRPNWPGVAPVDAPEARARVAHPTPALPESLTRGAGPIGFAAVAPGFFQGLRRPKRRWLTGARFAAILVSIGGPLFDLFLFWGLAESGTLSENADAAIIAIGAVIAILVGSFVAAGLLFAIDGRGVRGALEALVAAVPGAWLFLVSSTDELLQTVLRVAVVVVIVAGAHRGRVPRRAVRGSPPRIPCSATVRLRWPLPAKAGLATEPQVSGSRTASTAGKTSARDAALWRPRPDSNLRPSA